MKKKGVLYYKDKAWEACSQYIRQKYADWRGNATCITCGLTKPWKQQQAGHFIPGRRNSILFDIRNIHVQCYGCNVRKQGNSIKYFRFMQDKYGDKVIEELEQLEKVDKQFTIPELQEKIEHFKKLIKEL